MRYLLLLLLICSASVSWGHSAVLYISGIQQSSPDDVSDAEARIKDILINSGFYPKFEMAQVEFIHELNPSGRLADDLAELGIQSKNSSLALTYAKITNPDAVAGSPEYRKALGQLYYKKISNGAGDNENERHVYSVVKSLGFRIVEHVLTKKGQLIVVSHSQGNFFAEATEAYIRHGRTTDDLAALDQRLRFVGVASVAASTPSNRYMSVEEDIALSAHTESTKRLPNFDILPRNIDLCPNASLGCANQLLSIDPTVHGFLKIYTSELIDRTSGKSLAFLLAKLISDSFDEIATLPAAIERVSVASDGTQGNGEVWTPSLSSTGRYVAFVSTSSNLVPGDTNGTMDVFVHDRHTRDTTRVSIASNGTQAQGAGTFDAERPSISADGRFIAFTSSAHNLVPGDTNGVPDVFVHDRQSRETTRVSVASDGSQANVQHAYGSRNPSISADGRFVAFASSASNLVLNDANGHDDIFVHDRHTGTTTILSISTSGQLGNASSLRPSISADGQIVAFESGANNLLDDLPSALYESNIFVHDRVSQITSRVDVPSNGDRTYQNANSFHTSISAGGRFVAFGSNKANLAPNDMNSAVDVFVHDRQTATTTWVSAASNGAPGNAGSDMPAISGDGRFIVFTSAANNLVGSDENAFSDVYLHDRQNATTRQVSVAANGSQSTGESFGGGISSDGRSVAFVSVGNLIEADTNQAADVFAIGNSGP